MSDLSTNSDSLRDNEDENSNCHNPVTNSTEDNRLTESQNDENTVSSEETMAECFHECDRYDEMNENKTQILQGERTDQCDVETCDNLNRTNKPDVSNESDDDSLSEEEEYESADEGEIEMEEEQLKLEEEKMTEEEKILKKEEAQKYKEEGNKVFKEMFYKDAIKYYSRALQNCPYSYVKERSIMYSNRAACKLHMEKYEEAITDCSKAVELHPHYLKALLRRAELYEKVEKLEEALADYQRVIELDPSQLAARQACMRLPDQIKEKNEKMKEEMMGKLKDLGNMILKPFGLSTNNFKLNQDPNTGGYSVNFQQNSES